MGAKDQSFKHICKTCGYSTNRISNFKDHINRKKPCKPKEIESIIVECTPNVNLEPDSVNLETDSVNLEPDSVNLETDSVSLDVNHIKRSANIHQCPTCKKVFSCRQAKYKHLKNVKCKPPPPPQPTQESNLKTENERLQEENKKLQTALTEKTINSNQVINIYNDNSTNTTTTNSSTTNNVNILNNFDSPSLNHITAQMIGEMYLKSDRELPRMIGQAVRKIYKVPENDCIRIKYGNQAGFAEVKQDDETRILPVSDVLETVLSQTSTLCGKELQKCCGNDAGQIPGPNVVNHVNELSVLHWGFVPETHAQRQGYFKFVKSALM
jgi:hypothetical protein